MVVVATFVLKQKVLIRSNKNGQVFYTGENSNLHLKGKSFVLKKHYFNQAMQRLRDLRYRTQSVIARFQFAIFHKDELQSFYMQLNDFCFYRLKIWWENILRLSSFIKLTFSIILILSEPVIESKLFVLENTRSYISSLNA